MPSSSSTVSRPSKISSDSTKSTTRTKAPVLKKAEVEAMLLQAQKKLYDAENTLEEQTAELQELREQVTQQQELHEQFLEQHAQLVQLREKYYDEQVTVKLAQHRCNEARAAEAKALVELSHLTRLLAEAEQSIAAYHAAQEDMENLRSQLAAAKADTAEKQALQKRVAEQDQRLEMTNRELAAAKADAEETKTLRKRVAEQDQRLEAAHRELADLTGLLKQSEAQVRDTHATQDVSANVGRAAVAALIAPPNTTRLDHEHLNQAAAALVASGLFDPEYYLEHNSDVAEAGVDPALHFLEYGFVEGRNPRAPE